LHRGATMAVSTFDLSTPDPGLARAVPALHRGAVHVWRLDLDRLHRSDTGLAAVLTEAERERAARLHRPVDAERFIAGRASVRRLLAAYLGCATSAVRLTAGPHGKPALEDGAGLEFNLSHAEWLGVLAVTEVGSVGVDVERIGPVPELQAIADRFFTEREAAELRSATPRRRERLFHGLWTRKEAYLKALGGGLSIPLRSVDLTVSGPPRVLAIDGDPAAGREWTLRELRPEPGFRGSVAVRAGGFRLRRLEWTGTGTAAPRTA
jgi:4'-phosphopantetheinyl transferase